MIIERWTIDSKLEDELRNHYKTSYSVSLKNLEPMDIARSLTFDGLSDSITVRELSQFLQTLNKIFADGKIRGVGLEVGSGPGTFVAALANLSGVDRVYGVEACAMIVEALMEKVVDCIAANNTIKVTGAIGDFNSLNLPDSSIDFVFDFFSLHHSSNLKITLMELFRVLKPGGIIVCVDKARADMMNKEDLESLLDIEYSAKWKKEMGLPENKKHTRRMNGEYEYRLKDWKDHFFAAGFQSIRHWNVAKIGGFPIVRLVKRILSILPIPIQSKLSAVISRKISNNLEPSNRIFRNVLPSYLREFSLMIAQKG